MAKAKPNEGDQFSAAALAKTAAPKPHEEARDEATCEERVAVTAEEGLPPAPGNVVDLESGSEFKPLLPAVVICATHCPPGYVTRQVRVDPLTPRQALALKIVTYSLQAANAEVVMQGYQTPRRVENGSHAVRWLLEQSADVIEAAHGGELEEIAERLAA